MSLKKKIQSEKVRYAMNCGVLQVRASSRQMVQLENGQYRELVVPGVTIEAEGPGNENGVTRAFDPADMDDKRIIDAVEELIAAKPGVATNINTMLYRIGEFDAVRPFAAFDGDTFDPAAIETMFEVGDYSLENAMKYELQKDDPRTEMVKLLERIERKRKTVKADDTAKAIEL